MFVEPMEAGFPLALLFADPACQLLQALDIERARSSLTVYALLDQSAASKDAHVSRDCLVGQVEWFGELAHSRFPLCESAHDCSSRPVAEGGEGCVQLDIDRGNHGCHHICN